MVDKSALKFRDKIFLAKLSRTGNTFLDIPSCVKVLGTDEK